MLVGLYDSISVDVGITPLKLDLHDSCSLVTQLLVKSCISLHKRSRKSDMNHYF